MKLNELLMMMMMMMMAMLMMMILQVGEILRQKRVAASNRFSFNNVFCFPCLHRLKLDHCLLA